MIAMIDINDNQIDAPAEILTAAPPIYEYVYSAFTTDAISLLTLAGSWVDPFDNTETEDDEFTINAWVIAKRVFPDIALGISWAMWEGHRDADIDELIIREINARIAGECWDIETVSYGPMYDFYGIDWSDEDTVKKYREYGLLLNQINFERSDYHGRTIQHLSDTLWETQPDISAFIQWLSGWSGNTLFDMSYDSYAENGYVDSFEWTPEDLDFGWSMQTEAQTLITLAYDGEKALRKTETFIQFCEALLISNCLAISEVHHVID